MQRDRLKEMKQNGTDARLTDGSKNELLLLALVFLWGLNFGHTKYVHRITARNKHHPSLAQFHLSIHPIHFMAHITNITVQPLHCSVAIMPDFPRHSLGTHVSTVLAICTCNGSRRYRQRSSSKWNTRFLHSIQYSVIDRQALNG